MDEDTKGRLISTYAIASVVIFIGIITGSILIIGAGLGWGIGETIIVLRRKDGILDSKTGRGA